MKLPEEMRELLNTLDESFHELLELQIPDRLFPDGSDLQDAVWLLMGFVRGMLHEDDRARREEEAET